MGVPNCTKYSNSGDEEKRFFFPLQPAPPPQHYTIQFPLLFSLNVFSE